MTTYSKRPKGTPSTTQRPSYNPDEKETTYWADSTDLKPTFGAGLYWGPHEGDPRFGKRSASSTKYSKRS